MKTFDARGSGKAFPFILYGVLTLAMLVVLIPLIYVVCISFATKQEILTRGFFLIPREWTINAYGYLFTNRNFLNAFNNALYITVVGTVINIVLTGLMAYGLSKSWLKGRKTINLLVLFTMLFGGGMIPTYLVVKELHLLNSYWSLFLTGAIAPFNLIVMRSFFQNIPIELEESARMDGCGEFRLLWKIILPLSLPVVATFVLFYAVNNWNTYFNAILYLNDTAKWPLQVFLRQMLIETDMGMESNSDGFEYSQAVKMAAVVITALPLSIVYPFLQKHFNQGMMLGSVKG
ncbi:carbohydrate ABC transporter permease [Paenibacillus contaminans]|uniref:ABC transporter permease n=1 Tax=Paenibacillus contaminans TaxID=450362 RepID=A0A329M0U6_9BACL|nr:carbohydrate ABC transporter permease [Paenibacillus contaminans]RAV13300.1 ABC transporter permease [Paenibacillus contaminans]